MFHASSLLALLVAGVGTWSAVIMAVIVAITVAVLLSYGGARIEVTHEELVAGRARIPLRMLAAPRALDAAATRERIGPSADARAYLLVRPYVAPSVVVDVTDPRDPAPYWLVSTRHPHALAALLSGQLAPGAGSERSSDPSSRASADPRAAARGVSPDPDRAD
jgi:hypothetical protein